MTVLVAYATRGGSTREIAAWIAEELTLAGLPVELRAARDVHDIRGYTAIVLGSAMYNNGWHEDARRFAHRFDGRCAPRPVWVFDSGPLDASADTTDIPPVPQAAAAMRALTARGHVTFGGRLSEEARGWLGFVARRMAKAGHGGDFRNPARVRAWARDLAAQIRPVEVGAG